MTLKLNGSTSGSVSIDAPASTAGGADRTLTLPDKTATMSPRMVLEQFYHICDGSTIATTAGNITLPNCTGSQTTTQSWVDLTGSSISYQPPTGTTMVIYELNFKQQASDSFPIVCYTFYIDSDEITNQRFQIGGQSYVDTLQTFKVGIPIGGSASTTTGRQASWSSAKTLKLQIESHGSSNDGIVHSNNYWIDGTDPDTFHQPSIGITAIG